MGPSALRRLLVGTAVAAMALAGTAAPAVAAGRSVPIGSRPPYYLALGDSLAQGVMPTASGKDVKTNYGYANLLAMGLPGLTLKKLGCPGETTTTMIDGGVCRYHAGDQLDQALSFISHHRVALITLDIGANDVDGCADLTTNPPTIDEECVAAGIQATLTNLPVIVGKLRAAAPHAQLVGMNYYDPFLAAYLAGPDGQALAALSVQLTRLFNKDLRYVYVHLFHSRVADVADEFNTYNSAIDPNTGLPYNVESICVTTYMCTPAPQGPNIHATQIGYAGIAFAFAQKLRPKFTTP